MTTSMEVWYALKEAVFSDKKTNEKLLEIKKDIVKEYITKLKEDNPSCWNIEEQLEKYLINDGSVEDVFQDIFRWCWLYFLLPESIDSINRVKEKISSIQEIPTSEKLASLKDEILRNFHTFQTNPTSTISNNQTAEAILARQSVHTNNPHTTSQRSQKLRDNLNKTIEHFNPENKYIKSVCNRASQQIWKLYKRWGSSPNTWFDCSGLRYWAFKEEWINFSQRFTALAFSDANVKIRKDQAKPWDFMFWDQKPWKRKHSPVYHIEMIIDKPYKKNWKTYVRTLWSSTDAKDDRGNYVWKWVQIREREMKNYRHYGRPTYYYQLAQNERTQSRESLVASTRRPSQDLENHVLRT